MCLCDLYALFHLFHMKGKSYYCLYFTLSKLCLGSLSTGFMAGQMHSKLKLKLRSAWTQRLPSKSHSNACVVLVFLKPRIVLVQIYISWHLGGQWFHISKKVRVESHFFLKIEKFTDLCLNNMWAI